MEEKRIHSKIGEIDFSTYRTAELFEAVDSIVAFDGIAITILKTTLLLVAICGTAMHATVGSALGGFALYLLWIVACIVGLLCGFLLTLVFTLDRFFT